MSSDFALSLVFGAVVLIINAFNLFYSSPLTQAVGVNSYPILRGVGVDSLSSPRNQTQGLIFYIGIYLVVYAAALFFWELGQIVLDSGASSGSRGESGPQSNVPTLTESTGVLSGNWNARPLIIAMGMIAIMSSTTENGRYVRVLDAGVRHVAHRLAGIPHGIYRLITRLNAVDYAKAAEEDVPQSVALLGKIRKRLAAGGDADNVEARLQELEVNLRIIDVLRPSIHGTYDVFPVRAIELLKPLINDQKKKWDTPLDRALADSAAASGPLERSDVDDLAKRSSECSKNLKALFAILYRQTHSRQIAKVHMPTNSVLAELKSPDKYKLKDNAVIAVVLAFILMFFIYPLLDAYYRTTVTGVEVGGLMDVLKTNGVWLRTARFLIKCATLFSVSWIIVVSIRRAMIDRSDYWESYNLPILPVVRLIPAAFWPAVLSALAVTFVMIIFDLFLAGWTQLNRDLFAGFVVFQAFDLPMNFLLGVVVSVAVLVVADQHINLSIGWTCLLAVFFVLPFFILAVLGSFIRAFGETATATGNASINLSIALFDVLILSFFAIIALAIFAMLVEITEAIERRKEDSKRQAEEK